MTKVVCLPADQGPVLNAATWLRQHLDISKYENMETQFEEYFHCRVVREPPHDFAYGRIYAVFEREQDANWFILKWS